MIQAYLQQFLSSEFTYVAILALVFIGVSALVWSLSYWSASRSTIVKERLQRTVMASGGGNGRSGGALRRGG